MLAFTEIMLTCWMIMIIFTKLKINCKSCQDIRYWKRLQCFILFSKYTSNRSSPDDSFWASLSASLHLCMVLTNPSYMIRDRAPNVSYGQIITLPFPLALGFPVSLCRQEKQKSSGHTIKVQIVYCTYCALMTSENTKQGRGLNWLFRQQPSKVLSDTRDCLKAFSVTL